MDRDPTPAEQARNLYTWRHQQAVAMVHAGQMAADEAEDHLRPWLAIACLCGAAVPELDEGLADLRSGQIVWPVPQEERQTGRRGHAPGSRHGAEGDISGAGAPPPQAVCTESEARGRLASELCHRSRWAPILTRARDRALLGPLDTPEQCAAAVALADVARHLACDPNGRHHIPAFDPAGHPPALVRKEAA